MSTETFTFDESYPPDVLRPRVPVTGATAGTPGAWVPTNAYPLPASVAEANALGLSLGAAWTTGQYVVLENASKTHTYWNGTAFASGNAPAPAPAASSNSPVSGPVAGGSVVTVTGTNLTGSTGLTIGGVATTAFSVLSATQVRGTTGAHAAGAVDVVVLHPSGNATRTNGFTYVAAPTFTTVAPITGAAAGGTVTTLTGTGFTGATGATFGGAAGTAFSVTNATTIAVTTPAHAAGVVDVIVQHPGGNVTKTGGFEYT